MHWVAPGSFTHLSFRLLHSSLLNWLDFHPLLTWLTHQAAAAYLALFERGAWSSSGRRLVLAPPVPMTVVPPMPGVATDREDPLSMGVTVSRIPASQGTPKEVQVESVSLIVSTKVIRVDTYKKD